MTILRELVLIWQSIFLYALFLFLYLPFSITSTLFKKKITVLYKGKVSRALLFYSKSFNSNPIHLHTFTNSSALILRFAFNDNLNSSYVIPVFWDMCMIVIPLLSMYFAICFCTLSTFPHPLSYITYVDCIF